MKRLTIILITLTTAFQAVFAQKDSWEWRKVETPEGITFSMPGEATHEFSIQDGAPTHIYKSRDLNCLLGAVCSNFSNKKEMLAPEYHGSLVEILKLGSIPKEDYGKLVSEELIQKDTPLIYEINYTTESNKIQWSYIKRFIITESHIYQFTIGAKTRNTDQLKYESTLFFDSIELIKGNEKGLSNKF